MAQHVVGDCDEAGKVGRGQVAEEGMCGIAPLAVHPLRGGRALLGETDKGRAPVGRVGTAGDPPIAFEDVDERGDVPRRASQGLAELALNHGAADEDSRGRSGVAGQRLRQDDPADDVLSAPGRRAPRGPGRVRSGPGREARRRVVVRRPRDHGRGDRRRVVLPATHLEQRDALRRDPNLVPTAVEDTMRHAPLTSPVCQ